MSVFEIVEFSLKPGITSEAFLATVPTTEILRRALSGFRQRPLSLEFSGMVWTLTAWCEQRSAFRAFRLDGLQQLTATK